MATYDKGAPSMGMSLGPRTIRIRPYSRTIWLNVDPNLVNREGAQNWRVLGYRRSEQSAWQEEDEEEEEGKG